MRMQALTEDPETAALAYVTHEDLRELPDFRGETLIAIKAPSGSTLEVPDPDEGMPRGQRRYQVRTDRRTDGRTESMPCILGMHAHACIHAYACIDASHACMRLHPTAAGGMPARGKRQTERASD